MGTWALEHNPGLAGPVYQLVNFNGDVFGWTYSGAGAGVWRRTPPNWTLTIGAGNSSRGAVYDDKMWWGTNPAGGLAGRVISRSDDGIAWTLDLDLGAGAFTHWSAMGCSDAYLYAAEVGMLGVAGTSFRRRDNLGTWTANPPAFAGEPSHSQDIIRFEGVIYWSAGTDIRYSVADGAWADEPTLDGYSDVFFTEHVGHLWAVGTPGRIWRKVSGGWTEELDISGTGYGFGGAISVGGDGRLYVAAENGANSRVYMRVGGGWILHSSFVGARFKSAIADDSGNLFAGTHDCRFYVYTSDFAVTPIGLGLYPQAMDVDGDGNAIYVGLYNAAAQPILVKVAAPLVNNAMGNAVFNPLAGDAINVKCGGVGGELAISGSFAGGAGNEQVEVSEDGGATWTDIDRDAWGVERAQPLLVDPDDAANVVMVALATAQDITETLDGGGTAWTVNNAAVGYAPAAMAKLAEGDELVVGNAHAARKVEYSPNRGVELADITGGAAIGNVVALEVA